MPIQYSRTSPQYNYPSNNSFWKKVGLVLKVIAYIIIIAFVIYVAVDVISVLNKK